MRSLFTPLALALLLAAAGAAYGAGGGEMPSRPIGGSSAPPPTPEEQALATYNTGVRVVEKADQLAADAARQGDAKRRGKTLEKARSGNASALKKFTRATELNPSMHQAWNYVGYTNRKLGRFDAALGAYDRALALKPGYPEAIEYRGHAYLGLNRLSEAKEAYLTLFGSNRALATQLLAGMQSWVNEHRGNPAGIDASSLEAFAAWVSERSAIASQTAGLTRAGVTAAW
jgi:tetratricopeptide (TPR) repeat protein